MVILICIVIFLNTSSYWLCRAPVTKDFSLITHFLSCIFMGLLLAEVTKLS